MSFNIKRHIYTSVISWCMQSSTGSQLVSSSNSSSTVGTSGTQWTRLKKTQWYTRLFGRLISNFINGLSMADVTTLTIVSMPFGPMHACVCISIYQDTIVRKYILQNDLISQIQWYTWSQKLKTTFPQCSSEHEGVFRFHVSKPSSVLVLLPLPLHFLSKCASGRFVSTTAASLERRILRNTL